jgi:hypothetical protein
VGFLKHSNKKPRRRLDMAKRKAKQTINKVKSELRKKFYWFVEVTDRDLPNHYYKLATPTLLKEDYSYLEGKGELYVLSSDMFLWRRTYGNGNPCLILIGVELYDVDNQYHHAEYIYAISGYDNDYIHFVDLEEYYRIHSDEEPDNEENNE